MVSRRSASPIPRCPAFARSLSIPELGLNPMASWVSLTTALITLGYPAKNSKRRLRASGPPEARCSTFEQKEA
eukprot:2056634-Prymnesium_polylepis.1